MAFRNLSGYYCFTDVVPSGNYKLSVESDLYFAEEKSGLYLTKEKKASIASSIKPYITDKFTAYLSKEDIIITKLSLAVRLIDEYTGENPIGGIKVTLKKEGKETLHSLDPKKPVLEIALKPQPAYPFSNHATLARGKVVKTDPVANDDVEVKDKPVANADIEVKDKPRFIITAQSLENLKAEKIPDNKQIILDDILKKLEKIKYQEAVGQTKFLEKLKETIGTEQAEEYKDHIVKHAEGKRTKTDERGEFVLYFKSILKDDTTEEERAEGITEAITFEIKEKDGDVKPVNVTIKEWKMTSLGKITFP